MKPALNKIALNGSVNQQACSKRPGQGTKAGCVLKHGAHTQTVNTWSNFLGISPPSHLIIEAFQRKNSWYGSNTHYSILWMYLIHSPILATQDVSSRLLL